MLKQRKDVASREGARRKRESVMISVEQLEKEVTQAREQVERVMVQLEIPGRSTVAKLRNTSAELEALGNAWDGNATPSMRFLALARLILLAHESRQAPAQIHARIKRASRDLEDALRGVRRAA